MLGNDIIDLAIVNLKNAHKDRFIKKVFTVTEQKSLSTVAYPNQQIWTLWSMKESAYKLSVQRGRLKKFNPLDFTCELDTHYFGKVWVEGSYSFCQVDVDSTLIHCRSWVTDTERKSMVLKSTSVHSMKSDELYRHTILAIAKEFDFSKERLSILKNTAQIPFVYLDGIKQAISLSLSHHGNYGAYLFSSSS